MARAGGCVVAWRSDHVLLIVAGGAKEGKEGGEERRSVEGGEERSRWKEGGEERLHLQTVLYTTSSSSLFPHPPCQH
ncbi:hypothetical protein Pmani_017718 [Petrolisthes manimaculis]|uniref:Uncharacterized protein n=1 Tax=Petrolisthes manimaculis TaxID=1843537 RepID=A0AAE1PPH1_9EUCA|nr:hypothetical protein Pmani_017718 [Petrolisthes manimaculis]